MRWIYDKILIILLVLLVTPAWGLRISLPRTFQVPWNDEQITDLNNFTAEVFDMQKGRYEMDIETNVKTNANNGEIYLIQTGNTVRIQFKANGHIFTVTPDGW